MADNQKIVIDKNSFSVYGTEVPSEYMEGHEEIFRYLVRMVPLNENFDIEKNNISFSPGKDGDPQPNGEPGGEGGAIQFLIKDDVFMRLTYHEISIQGEVQDQSDPVAHAIAVYSGFREFLRISEALDKKKVSVAVE